jgi:Ca-activated chloride channel family protein
MRVLPFVCVLAVASVAAQQQQPPIFKSGARTVAVYATVTDGDGRLVPDLAQEDFEVRDSGKAVPISVFSREVQPITLVMMLDRSGSMRGNFQLVDQSAEAFVRAMQPNDKAKIGSFAEKVQLDPEEFTGDQAALIKILRTRLQQRGPTPLWNAMDMSVNELKGQNGRRVVLLFTDGADNPMNFKLNNMSFMDVQRRAQEADVMVYAIGLESRDPAAIAGGGFGAMGGGRPDPGLPAIAGETGGGYFELRTSADLAATFSRVAEELRRQYLIGFTPQKLDGKMHKIEVRIKKGGMKVRARKEYHAAKQDA